MQIYWARRNYQDGSLCEWSSNQHTLTVVTWGCGFRVSNKGTYLRGSGIVRAGKPRTFKTETSAMIAADKYITQKSVT